MWVSKDYWSGKLWVDWWVNALVDVMVVWWVDMWVVWWVVAMAHRLVAMKVYWLEMT